MRWPTLSDAPVGTRHNVSESTKSSADHVVRRIRGATSSEGNRWCESG